MINCVENLTRRGLKMAQDMMVYKANDLVCGTFSMTLNEYRLLQACIVQIKDPRKPLTDEDEFTVTALDYAKWFHVDPKNAYADINAAVSLLNRQEVILDRPDPDEPRLSKTTTGWIDWVNHYNGNGNGDGKVVVKFRRKILPFISDLKEGYFTRCDMTKMVLLKTVYAKRLYELLMSEAYKKQDVEISISTLRTIFVLRKKYQDVVEFKRCVIDPSVKSINELTDMTIAEPEQRKTGREVTHLIFKYTVKQDPKKQNKLPSKRDLEKAARPGESYADVAARLANAKKVIALFRKRIKYILEYMKENKETVNTLESKKTKGIKDFTNISSYYLAVKDKVSQLATFNAINSKINQQNYHQNKTLPVLSVPY